MPNALSERFAMLILEIALGIVLAVIILAFLPQILAAGFWLFLAAVVIAVIVAASSSGIAQTLSVGMIILVCVAWAMASQKSRVGDEVAPSPEQSTTSRYCVHCRKIFNSSSCPTCEPKESERASEGVYWG